MFQEICGKDRKAQAMNGGKPHCWLGTVAANRTAIVLSCPGRLEEFHGKPAAGVTGKNLDQLLDILKSHRPDIFCSCDRYDYTITNSSDQVHYKSKTGNTEPDDEEIRAPENLRRLQDELSGCTNFLVLGNRAALAVDNAGFKSGIIYCDRHLSMLRLNTSINRDIDGKPIRKGEKGNTAKRIKVVAASIINNNRLFFSNGMRPGIGHNLRRY